MPGCTAWLIKLDDEEGQSLHLYQLRTYTLDSEAAADAYEEVWRRHLSSLPKCGICPHGIWRPTGNRDRLTALVSFPADADPEELDRTYMSSPGFHEDFEGFTGKVLGVEAVMLKPTAASPMR